MASWVTDAIVNVTKALTIPFDIAKKMLMQLQLTESATEYIGDHVQMLKL